jgi:hypothetical protein
MGAFLPSDKMQVLLVDPNGAPYVLAALMANGSFLPSDKARAVLVDEDGQPYKAVSGNPITGIDATVIITGVATLTFTNGVLTAIT